MPLSSGSGSGTSPVASGLSAIARCSRPRRSRPGARGGDAAPQARGATIPPSLQPKTSAAREAARRRARPRCPRPSARSASGRSTSPVRPCPCCSIATIRRPGASALRRSAKEVSIVFDARRAAAAAAGPSPCDFEVDAEIADRHVAALALECSRVPVHHVPPPVRQHPGVLDPAALARVHHQRALLQRHPRQAARAEMHLAPDQAERPQVDVPRRQPLVLEGRAGRERQRRLGDEVGRIRLDPLGIGRDLLLGRLRPDQHPVAARAVHLLDHQLLEVLEHVLRGRSDRRTSRSARSSGSPARRGRSGSSPARRYRPPCRRRPPPPAPSRSSRRPSGRRSSAPARPASNRGGSRADRGSCRRSAGRSRRPASAPRWCACRRSRPARRGPAPRPARSPSGRRGTNARSRRC